MIRYFNLLVNNIYDDVFCDDDVNILNNLRQLDYHILDLNNHYQKTLIIHDDGDDFYDDDDYGCGDFYVIHIFHNHLFHPIFLNDDDDDAND